MEWGVRYILTNFFCLSCLAEFNFPEKDAEIDRSSWSAGTLLLDPLVEHTHDLLTGTAHPESFLSLFWCIIVFFYPRSHGSRLFCPVMFIIHVLYIHVISCPCDSLICPFHIMDLVMVCPPFVSSFSSRKWWTNCLSTQLLCVHIKNKNGGSVYGRKQNVEKGSHLQHEEMDMSQDKTARTNRSCTNHTGTKQ